MIQGLEQSIDQAVQYLGTRQEEHGSFWIWTSVDPQFPDGSRQEQSMFGTACILYCLEWLHDACVEDIRNRALVFLRAETNQRGLCRYLSSASQSQMLGSIPIPFTTLPDVDTTACVSYLLRRHGTITDNLAILLNNRDADNLFKTWLMQEPLEDTPSGFPFICLIPHQNRICAGVNSNALFYLGETDQTRGTAEKLGEIFRNKAHGKAGVYYEDEIVLFYFFSRAFYAGVPSLGKARQSIQEQLAALQQSSGSFGTPLRTAMAICTLLNFDSLSQVQASSIRFLLETQQESGSWPCECFYIGQDDDVTQEWHYGSLRRTYEGVLPKLYFGSEEITTAYCLEALSRCQEAGL